MGWPFGLERLTDVTLLTSPRGVPRPVWSSIASWCWSFHSSRCPSSRPRLATRRPDVPLSWPPGVILRLSRVPTPVVVSSSTAAGDGRAGRWSEDDLALGCNTLLSPHRLRCTQDCGSRGLVRHPIPGITSRANGRLRPFFEITIFFFLLIIYVSTLLGVHYVVTLN